MSDKLCLVCAKHPKEGRHLFCRSCSEAWKRVLCGDKGWEELKDECPFREMGCVYNGATNPCDLCIYQGASNVKVLETHHLRGSAFDTKNDKVIDRIRYIDSGELFIVAPMWGADKMVTEDNKTLCRLRYFFHHHQRLNVVQSVAETKPAILHSLEPVVKRFIDEKKDVLYILVDGHGNFARESHKDFPGQAYVCCQPVKRSDKDSITSICQKY